MAANLEIAFDRHELEGFVSNRVWKHILATLIDRASGLMEENNQIDPFKDPTKICRNQGIIVGLGEVIDLPAIMAEQIEYEKKNKKEEKKENG